MPGYKLLQTVTNCYTLEITKQLISIKLKSMLTQYAVHLMKSLANFILWNFSWLTTQERCQLNIQCQP